MGITGFTADGGGDASSAGPTSSLKRHSNREHGKTWCGKSFEQKVVIYVPSYGKRSRLTERRSSMTLRSRLWSSRKATWLVATTLIKHLMMLGIKAARSSRTWRRRYSR